MTAFIRELLRNRVGTWTYLGRTTADDPTPARRRPAHPPSRGPSDCTDGAATIIRRDAFRVEPVTTPASTRHALQREPTDQCAEEPDVSSTTSDSELAARSLTDAEAFGQLYDRYCDRIFRFIFARLHDRATAEDITSETFFKALRGISTYRAAAGPFSSWLYQIARNTMIDHLDFDMFPLLAGTHRYLNFAIAILDSVVNED